MLHCAGHTAITGTLRGQPLCVDLGFNRGEFSRVLIDRFGVPVHGVEPVRALAQGAPHLPGLVLHNVAIGGQDGTARLHSSPGHCASIYPSPEQRAGQGDDVSVWSLRTMWSNLPDGEIGLVKVDVEGAEFEVFRRADTTLLRRARQYTVEFHDFLWKDRGREVREIFETFRAADFVPVRFSRDNSNVVFLRRDWLPAGQLGRLWLLGPVRIWMGLTRILRRRTLALGVRDV